MHETCVYCGAMPHIKKISGLNYAQCSNAACTDNEPYEFIGLTEKIALQAWDEKQSSLKKYKPNTVKGRVGRGRKYKGARSEI